jgi:hypothetical protein
MAKSSWNGCSFSKYGRKSIKKELSKPKKEWKKIKQKTIEDYFNGFTEYLKSVKK